MSQEEAAQLLGMCARSLRLRLRPQLRRYLVRDEADGEPCLLGRRPGGRYARSIGR
ncbi:MAG: hypothetical protein LBB76_07580 [Azoarcus sp.]|nr:hypothetical protein [Azoarcus sp.]